MSNQHRTRAGGTRFPVRRPGAARAFDAEPVEIDGMRVLFDKRVTLFPVTLEERQPAAGASRAASRFVSRAASRGQGRASSGIHGAYRAGRP